MIDLDSSALMKVVLRESETADLIGWLSARPEDPVATSELARVEVARAARRAGGRAIHEARAVIGDLDLVPMTPTVLDLASEIGEGTLRTLDAIHLASAIVVRDVLSAFVAYDRRLVAAASDAGLVVASPGAA